MCIIAPAAERIPQWTAIFKCFDVYVWISLLTTTFISGCFWFLLKCWYYYYSDKKFGKTNTASGRMQGVFSFRIVLGDIWKIMLGATTRMPKRNMERIFIGACLLANLIIVGTFQVSSYPLGLY